MADLKYLKIFEDFITQHSELYHDIQNTLDALKDRQNILLLTTSNRWLGDSDTPKSSLLAQYFNTKFPNTSQIIDVSKLNIHMCEGNVSKIDGNNCGVKEALLRNIDKNPSNQHRCWASFNNPDDELWKISKELLQADTVIFFTSIRWGQSNAVYQKLIERLTWLENRHSTFSEDNILKNIKAGFIAIGQNWNGSNVVNVQRDVLKFFGFDTSEMRLFWNWQYTFDMYDESQESYQQAGIEFKNELDKL